MIHQVYVDGLGSFAGTLALGLMLVCVTGLQVMHLKVLQVRACVFLPQGSRLCIAWHSCTYEPVSTPYLLLLRTMPLTCDCGVYGGLCVQADVVADKGYESSCICCAVLCSSMCALVASGLPTHRPKQLSGAPAQVHCMHACTKTCCLHCVGSGLISTFTAWPGCQMCITTACLFMC